MNAIRRRFQLVFIYWFLFAIHIFVVAVLSVSTNGISPYVNFVAVKFRWRHKDKQGQSFPIKIRGILSPWSFFGVSFSSFSLTHTHTHWQKLYFSSISALASLADGISHHLSTHTHTHSRTNFALK